MLLSLSPQTPVGTPPLQNCEPIESRLRIQIQGCWREPLRECKEKDTDKQGTISAAEFLGSWPRPQGGGWGWGPAGTYGWGRLAAK